MLVCDLWAWGCDKESCLVGDYLGTRAYTRGATFFHDAGKLTFSSLSFSTMECNKTQLNYDTTRQDKLYLRAFFIGTQIDALYQSTEVCFWRGGLVGVSQSIPKACSSFLFDLRGKLPRRSELFVLVTESILLYVLGTPSSQADIDICDRD
jgi:hypothetical protein